MPEVTNYLFDYKEVAEALIKKQGIHEGLWHVAIEFGFGAQNVRTPLGFAPAAIIPVQKIGLTRTDVVSNLTVDAAEVNPASGTPKTKREGGRKAGKRREK
jgi:hypothetical protein